ncbi:MAG TPA: ABC transporter substrate-binding protein [Gaiellaceae bacterium]|jgi:putative spermidine/putrescine transport system substrate-binding protein
MNERERDERLQASLERTGLTRRDLLRRGAVVGAGFTVVPAVLAACGGGDDEGGGGGGSSGAAAQPPASGTDVPISEIEKNAKAEGAINTIALPPDWANYGEVMQTFQTKYGLKLTNASPNASSAEENQAVKSLKGQSRAPDVLDVGPSFAAAGKTDNLYAAYKNSQWDTIPDNMKDADGFWVGDYWGAVAFGANEKVAPAPTSWEELKDPKYKGKVALNGDPRESGSAFAGVFAASLANGGSLDDIQPGIDFFAELKKSGNFITVDATPATVANGQTPVTIDWDYLQIAYGDEFKSNVSWKVSVPSDGVFGNYYCQAINAEAPHPWAARLWQEFCYSDEGQILWLKGFTHPARFQDLSDNGKIPQDLLSKLPPADAYKDVQFPNQQQSDAATKIIADQWGKAVGV